jgi:hypothetical protein
MQNIKQRLKQDTMNQHDYFKKGLYVFIPKNFFIWMNFGTMFLQLVIINVYSCPGTWHVFFSSLLNKYEFLKLSWFLVNLVFCL